MIVIFLDETEGELVVNQEIIYLEKSDRKSFNNIFYVTNEWQLSEVYTYSELPAVATTDNCDSIKIQRRMLCGEIKRNFQAILRPMQTSEIEMSVIKSNDCNQAVQFSHQADNN